MNKSVTTLRTPVKLLYKCYPWDYTPLVLIGQGWPLTFGMLIWPMLLSVIGLLLYWPVAVFIGHAGTQRGFDPPTEAIVCHSLHPRTKPCSVWDICQILPDQRMTITQTGVHISPTAALEGSWPLSTDQVKKHRWDGGSHTCMHLEICTPLAAWSAAKQKR